MVTSLCQKLPSEMPIFFSKKLDFEPPVRLDFLDPLSNRAAS